MKMFRKCLEKFGIVSNLQEKSEKVLKESSGAKELREQLEFVEELKMIPVEKPVKNFERSVGEKFEYEGTILEAVSTPNGRVGCNLCFFDKPFELCGKSLTIRGTCHKVERKDGKEIHFTKAIAIQTKQPQEGLKLDQDKISYTLLPFKAITEVVKVLEFGKQKYAKDNWQKVPNGKERYIDAALRHIISYIGGETTDPESGLHHLAHATCCLLFVIWFDFTGKEGDV